MPRKTRKQKLNAQKRHHALSGNASEQLSREVPQTVHIEQKTVDDRQVKIVTKFTIISEADTALRRYTVRDIIRTITIISFLFAAQAGVYFAQSHGYLSHILP